MPFISALNTSSAGCFITGLIKHRLFGSHFSYSYFHKVPAEAPALELKASYGLAEPTPFEFPALSAQCTPEVYATFDLTKGPKDDKVEHFPSRIRFRFMQKFPQI